MQPRPSSQASRPAVGYYGGAIVRFADDKPKVPTQLHFGERTPVSP